MKYKSLLVVALVLCAASAQAADSLNCRVVGSCVIRTASVCAYGDIACADSRDSGVYVLNISDKSNPHVIGHTYVTRTANDLVMNSDTCAYIADGVRVARIGLSDPSNPTYGKSTSAGGWVQFVTIDGDYLYASLYSLGLKIFDVSSPDTIRQVGYTALTGHIFQQPIVVGDYCYVNSWDSGFSVVDISNKANPIEVARYRPDTVAANHSEDLAVRGNLVYMSWMTRVHCVDVSDLENITSLGVTDYLGGYVYNVRVSGLYVYVVVGNVNGLRVVDVSDPSNPVEVGHYRDSVAARAVNLADGYAYVTWVGNVLKIIQFYGGGAVVEEGGRSVASRSQLGATIVRGNLFLTGDRRPETGDRVALMDAAGRRVMELRPGPNDVHHLSPGVYFVRSQSAVEKVLLTR